MRREEGSSGSQGNREDMERMAGSTGATGATSTGMQDTGSTTYQQQGYPQQPGYQEPGTRTQASASYGQAPARGADYGPSGSGRPATSRHGSALSILAGALAFLEGLAFVIRSHFYNNAVAGSAGYVYRWNLHGWGWTLLILGALLIAGGVSHLLGIKGSRHFAAAIAVITAVVAFITIFYSVIWGIVVVAACAFAAHSLLSDRSREESYGDERYGAGGQSYGSTGQAPERQEAMSQGQRSRPM
jgi:hypothetical protein